MRFYYYPVFYGNLYNYYKWFFPYEVAPISARHTCSQNIEVYAYYEALNQNRFLY